MPQSYCTGLAAGDYSAIACGATATAKCRRRSFLVIGLRQTPILPTSLQIGVIALSFCSSKEILALSEY